MSFTFSANAGLRINSKIKSSLSLSPWASPIPTTSYLSKAARIADTAGLGGRFLPRGLPDHPVWARLIAGSTVIRNSNTVQHWQTSRHSSRLFGRSTQAVSSMIGLSILGMLLLQYEREHIYCTKSECSAARELPTVLPQGRRD